MPAPVKNEPTTHDAPQSGTVTDETTKATRALAAALARASAEGEGVPREAALGHFRRHLARLQTDVRHEFESHAISGAEAARRLSAMTDGLVATLFDFARGEALRGVEGMRPDLPGLSVIATGGYGRGLLAPFSDIDLLFLTTDAPGAASLAVVEYMLYFLWDLGLKVGHATRSIADCVAESAADTTIRTSMIDARLLAGDAALFDAFIVARNEACRAEGPAGFLAAKQHERSVRHARYGESPFMVEPNIKEGRGGLRDLQTIYWMARYVFGIHRLLDLVGEVPADPLDMTPRAGADAAGTSVGLLTEQEGRHARRAWDFLWTLRFHLHYVAGRAEERLTFDMQPVIGARMGYTRHGRQVGVERFMRHYFLTARDVMRLTHVLEPTIRRAALGAPALTRSADPELEAAGFTLADNQLLPKPGVSFRDTPIAMLRILRCARDRDLALHPLAMHAMIRYERQAAGLRGDAEASAIFLDLLAGTPGHPRTDGARWLSRLNETGLLSRLVQPWSRIVGQMQFDTYHVFTVDEHTIEAVRVLNMLERHEVEDTKAVVGDLVDDLQSRRALYVAVLLHDIAKGRGGDHSELGAEIAQDICPTLGMSAEETETVSWLVLHHLLLSQTAFRRDIDDPKTILDLADTIQSPERLKLLLLLTVVDMKAVSPKVWNAWKATLLRELYVRVAEVLAGGLATTERDARVARAKETAATVLRTEGFDEGEISQFLGLGYGSYWLGFDPETHTRHARMIREAEASSAPFTVETQPLPARDVTEVTVYTHDHAGLFFNIAGALAVAGASIVDARIHTLTNGMALDTFWIQDASGTILDQPHRLAKLSVLIQQTVSGALDPSSEIEHLHHGPRRMRAIGVPPRVLIDNRASNTHTVVEVNGRDRPGLLYDVTHAMSELGVTIASAHITTYGVRAVDVFYIKDVFGLKITSERKLADLRAALLGVLRASEETQAPETPAVSRRRRKTA
ncbi:[protein-PII] uridylyltransferase [Endobacter medicaginis]|uniref:Bifunctional uridylyltransferase/uridylyl-removing enzyme n=1 Tax=Endobacter medicaginis TaxID=1181271 RepID=A0A850NP69_9PROT|nr:[protein-PII] uridylyltransferase [Endobacter medicaginis]MBB3174397.1 [protein-PII] uridylyltransferase [Endobacter medicaginis]MCX5475318.1 [protein-PII] uridylyltransferase [Endobacter medicaginis]NVN30714.1 [protein-PII] uridylyltransferase [Endobacter medicaginis]